MKRGITISTLSISVTIMLIIATTASVIGVRSINTANFEDYKSKLRRMNDSVLEYVDTNNTLPTTGEIISVEGLNDDFIQELYNNEDITGKLYIVDIDKLDVNVNIGTGSVKNEDVFVVSDKTYNVYYLKGKAYKGDNYYSLNSINMINLPEIVATSIEINGKNIIVSDNTEQLAIDFIPNNTTNKKIIWSSSDTSIAVVGKSGKIVGKNEGTAIITAINGNLTATYEVTVIAPKIGDLVDYTPTANPNGSYSGATYIKDAVTTSPTYNTYIESTTNYTPGNMTWAYLGQDANGNILLTSTDVTSFTMTIAGQDGWVTGPDRMDTLCNTLYGNSNYGIARNMKIEDVNRVLGYPGKTGYLGSYYNAAGSKVDIPTPKTIGELETELGKELTGRQTPRLSSTAFEDYLSDYYNYAGTTYKANTTGEYKLIFTKADGTTTILSFWLSSPSVNAYFSNDYARFRVRIVLGEGVRADDVFYSNFYEDEASYALRPVIVLNSNVYFGTKNANGEWTLNINDK